MLIRIRSKDGNSRFQLEPSDDIRLLVEKIIQTASKNVDPASITISNQPRGNETLVTRLTGRNLQSLGLKHGDLVFVSYQDLPASTPSDPLSAPANSHTHPSKQNIVQEDPVDTYWRSRDGKIPRGRDSRFCKHASNGMCDYCMPLEPYDAAYQAEHSIKHLSCHAYIRKISPKSSSAAAQALPPLSPTSYKVRVPCPSGNHPSWPSGICTACQPSAITLQSQSFRMVDHLEFATHTIVERFLQAWRATGLQRLGWLIGRYEPYNEVPMGIKAVVEAIYEPPQEGELDGLTLGIPWEDEQRIRELAKSASTPLSIVGYIFTDLDPTPDDRTKNVYKRHVQSYFVSSLEAIFSATIQNANPTPSRSSSSGTFGSRMITAILTATEDGQVDVSAWQVSEQACAMAAADMIEASVEPGIVRVKEEDRSQDSARYVPDVFYRYKNEYGFEVKKSAKPCFPVEYLLVNVTHGFPQAPNPMFQSTEFAIENRPGLEDQQVQSILSSLNRLVGTPSSEDMRDGTKRLEVAKWLSDWHLIAFLETTQLLSPDDTKILMRTATSPRLLEDPSVLEAFMKTEGWQTLITFARESAPARPTSSAPTDLGPTHDKIPQDIFDQIAADDASQNRGSNSRIRICPHCTFENDHGGHDCEVCGLPLG
ncbi:NPL4 family-domain-containing protein [Boletus edulis BED1]|uniref:Nuclear protein localization protein 4 n=1 Tax=Boletus edulis BED1 TaxID=1328754 RepID=A0AAD4C1N5_BOLED|nr:NPL4 family-domain-containing protein [Boletus edulis BED1]